MFINRFRVAGFEVPPAQLPCLDRIEEELAIAQNRIVVAVLQTQ